MNKRVKTSPSTLQGYNYVCRQIQSGVIVTCCEQTNKTKWRCMSWFGETESGRGRRHTTHHAVFSRHDMTWHVSSHGTEIQVVSLFILCLLIKVWETLRWVSDRVIIYRESVEKTGCCRFRLTLCDSGVKMGKRVMYPAWHWEGMMLNTRATRHRHALL